MAYNPYNPNQGYTGPGSGAQQGSVAGNPYQTGRVSGPTPIAPTADFYAQQRKQQEWDAANKSPWLSQLAGAANANDVQNPIKKNMDGTWSVPETFMAGNRWSKGNINKDWATSFGGTYSAGGPAMGMMKDPNGMNYTLQATGGTGPGNWTFKNDPTQYLSSGEGATFQGGQGSNNSWKSFLKEVAPIAGIAALPFAAAGLAGMAGYGGGISGMSGMAGAGASGAGAALPAGAMQTMTGSMAAGASGVGGALAPAAGGLGAAGAGGAAMGGAGGLLSGSIPSMAGVPTMAGSGVGAMGGTGFGAAGMTAPTLAQMGSAGVAGSSGLGGMLGQAKEYLGSGLSSLMPGGGGAGGGGGGMDLLKLGLGGLSSALNYNQSSQMMDKLGQAQDPFGDRTQYQRQLSNLWGNPSQYMKDPGIDASFNAGLEAVRRGTPGQALDGRMNNQLMQYGMQFVPEMQRNTSNALAPLAGAGLYTPYNPQAYSQAAGGQTTALNQLFNGIGNTAQKWWGQSPVQPQNTSYNWF